MTIQKILITALVGATVAVGCKSNSSDNYVQPKPGVVVDSMAMPVEGDINHAVFSVAIVVDSDQMRAGLYDVRAAFGESVAEGKFSMPKGGEKNKPIVRKAKEPFRYVVGFKVPDDTTFYEYFEVQAQRSPGVATIIGMKYLKSYSFE